MAVNVRDRFNHPQVPDEDQELAAELIDKDGNSVGTTTVSQREGSTNEFIVIYRSHQEGEHKLSITLEWYENRVLYYNLKSKEVLNIPTKSEVPYS